MTIAAELLGVQAPSLSYTPKRVSSVGPAAIELAQLAGLELDPWQRYVVTEALGEKDEWYHNKVLDKMCRRSSAYEIALIVARQNGKGTIMEALELAWLFLCGAKTICHSAHEFATSKEHFQRIESLISGTPELKAELARGGIKWSHGDESITLANGQRLIFKTRTRGAARGFSIDKLVMDEAMILKQDAVKAMTYATSARPDVQIMYAGSAGDKDSAHFGRARQRGIEGSDPRLFFAEWSANICTDACYSDCEEHDDPDDPKTWAKANPALGYRIQVESCASERAGDPEGFLQERLSVGDWPVEGDEWRIISKELWMARNDQLSRINGDFVLAIDTPPNPTFSCISAAGLNAEGMTHTEITGYEVLDYRPGMPWVVNRVLEICRAMKPLAVVIDKTSQASQFIAPLTEPLERLGIEILHPGANEFAQACGEFYTAVVPRKGNEPTLVHRDQVPLTQAVAGADTRDLSGMWAWHKRNSATDVSPLIACTLAAWGLKKMQFAKQGAPPLAIWARR